MSYVHGPSVRLTFLGSRHAFNPHHVGGTDSLVRRLSTELVERGHAEVQYVLYGFDRSSEEVHSLGLRSRFCRTFTEALQTLEGSGDHVVSVYLLPRDRVPFALFRRRHGNRLRFHGLYQVWPESPLKRWLTFLDSRLEPYNGCALGMSPRIARRLAGGRSKAALLWPPVPRSYFVPRAEKRASTRLRVTFIGREDPGKGALEVIEVFNVLSRDPRMECVFYGMHWPQDPRSVAVHEQLAGQREFKYKHVDFAGYTPAVDEMVRSALRNTDVFMQPYRRLSSTIDTPVLLLEAMASLAPVISRRYGNLPDIYGPSRCLLEGSASALEMVDLVRSAPDWLDNEQDRIDERNAKLRFDVESVADAFGRAIGLEQGAPRRH